MQPAWPATGQAVTLCPALSPSTVAASCSPKPAVPSSYSAAANNGLRREEHEHTSFTFLGYTFRQRRARNRSTGRHFSSFLPAMSPEAHKATGTQLRRMAIHRHTNLTLDDLARRLNPVVRGWMQYYGRFYRSVLWPLLRRVSTYLMRWARAKYRRLRADKRFRWWWRGVQKRTSQLFAHWAWVREY